MRAMGGRPVLMERYPHGAEGKSFFQKRVPDNAPDWLTTEIVSTPNGTTSHALVIADLAHVAWAVNLGCLGFHVWPARADDPDHADELRIDLDPDARHRLRRRARRRASRARAARRARHRRLPEDHGQARHPRVPAARAALGSVSRCGTRRSRSRASSRAAIPSRSPTRGGRKNAAQRIFVDFNQNAPHKTVFGAWCVRAAARRAGVDAVRVGRARDDRSRRADDRERARRASPNAATRGPTSTPTPQSIEPLLALYDRDIANGMTDAPWPPVYPKMPGEPPRVAPSRAKKPKPDRINPCQLYN